MGHTDNMRDYREFVSQKAEDEDGEVVLNRTPEHAAIVIAALISKANSIVEIVSDRLPDSVWGSPDVVEATISFLRKSGQAKLRIVVEEPISPNENVLLRKILSVGLGNQVRLFVVDREVMSEFACHFAVVDGRHFRFQGDTRRYEAMVQFGVDSSGGGLRKTFAAIRERSRELEFV